MLDDADELLGARLDEALRTGLDTDQVDVSTLLHGSRRRARRLRNRRIATVTTLAALVVGGPVGYEVVNAGPNDTAPPAAMLPSSSGSPGLRNSRPVSPPAPRPIPSGPTSIPDSFAFTGTQLPPGLVLTRSDRNPGQVLVGGQDCEQPSAGDFTRPTVGRQWVWSAPGGSADAPSVSLTVTGWASGQAETAFTDAIGQSGFCRWRQPQTKQSLTVDVPGGQSWAATSTDADLAYGRALIQIGGGIVGIEVADPGGVADATRLLDELATVEAARLSRSSALTGPGVTR